LGVSAAASAGFSPWVLLKASTMACWRASLSRTGDAAGVLVMGETAVDVGDTGVVLAAGLETGDGDAAAGVDAGAAAGAAIDATEVSIAPESSTESFGIPAKSLAGQGVLRSRPLAADPDLPEPAS
jgi:hypothetical protein